MIDESERALGEEFMVWQAEFDELTAELAKARAEVDRMRPVYETALDWHKSAGADNETFALIAAVEYAAGSAKE